MQEPDQSGQASLFNKESVEQEENIGGRREEGEGVVENQTGMLRVIQYSGSLAEWAIARTQITSA